jgi:aminopeptidase N
MGRSLLLIAALLFSLGLVSQQYRFTEQDTLRGSITPERAWWDLKFYDLNVAVDIEAQFITGTNLVRYEVLQPGQSMQLDLQPPMELIKVTQDGEELTVTSKGNARFIQLKKPQTKGVVNEVVAYFEGRPKVAENPPWDGGFSWEEDSSGNPFIATSCQGLGASVWWPNKDHMYDEVDSMAIHITAPSGLVGVANGRLQRVEEGREVSTYHWFVKNPISNYGVNINLANYVTFGGKYSGEKGELDLEYYVLPQNLEKAREQFKQVPAMFEAFEYWFGPYPFYEDGYKLVEVPYLGMEHQSSITYGNGYRNGYLGYDLSGTGWGLKFDFIIIHESGHEWFANNITNRDIADMWIHEGFTAYSENLYLEYHYGKEAAADYVIGTREHIRNDRPIIGQYDVNNSGSGDMYYKGANMLHTLRQLVEDDTLWRDILRGVNKTFYHQTVTTGQIENYFSKASGKDLSAFFNQYLRSSRIPVLEYRTEGEKHDFRYTDIVKDFDMPLLLIVNGESHWIFPDSEWKSEALGTMPETLEIDRNFYVNLRRASVP